MLPRVVLIITSNIASIGVYTTRVKRVKMLDRPILAPGKNRGGSKFSNINEIKLKAHKTDIEAVFLEEIE